MSSDNELHIEMEEQEESQEWLITMSDLNMLLLTFFIMLYAMSDIDTKRFTDSFMSVKEALGGKDKAQQMSARITPKEAGVMIDQVRLRQQLIEAQKKVFADMQFFNSKKGVEGIVGATIQDGVITLRLPGDALFQTGQVELTQPGKDVIHVLRDFLIQHPDQQINIKGYTDDQVAKGSGRFLDNWEISSMRAVNVLRFLVSLGIEPNRLTATGLADLQPILPNTSPENRAKNRRVEFVLEKRVGR